MEDMAALLQYLQKEAEQRRLDDDRRRAEEAEQRRDDDRRRAEEADLRRQEFATFMATLTTRPPSSPPNDTQQPTQNNKPHTRCVGHVADRATAPGQYGAPPQVSHATLVGKCTTLRSIVAQQSL
ncbi:hypothetical protein Pmani_012179 [Petrolisthes manimaculis]|uniref:Uncharacterized protein n=1 Tax=Petrolisthes manimaculis TaxID=1843537 RepID=A0AAE1UEX7_9EUCA|nr:hypothetical protein Pmani_012179 [Petrolisthes manimaculis]